MAELQGAKPRTETFIRGEYTTGIIEGMCPRNMPHCVGASRGDDTLDGVRMVGTGYLRPARAMSVAYGAVLTRAACLQYCKRDADCVQVVRGKVDNACYGMANNAVEPETTSLDEHFLCDDNYRGLNCATYSSGAQGHAFYTDR